MGFTSTMQFLRDILTLLIIIIIVAGITGTYIYNKMSNNQTSTGIPIIKNIIPIQRDCYYNGQPIDCKTMDQELLKKETSPST